jgi:MRG
MGREGNAKPNKRKKDSSDALGGNMGSASRKRRSGDADATIGTHYEEYCELPFTLRTVLVDEYGYITRKGFDSPNGYDCEPASRPARSVHVLPARVTVRQVLQHYQRKRGTGGGGSRSSTGGTGTGGPPGGAAAPSDPPGTEEADKLKRQQQIRKFCEGLCLLFDDALPVCLLYQEERPQYESIQDDDDLKLKRPCEIYGSTFLLRLLVRLPILLRAEPSSEMEVMGPLIADLIVLLQKNRQACFLEAYREPKRCELLPWEMNGGAAAAAKASDGRGPNKMEN